MSRPLLPLLLVVGQVMTAVGFPVVARPSARLTACDCRTTADRQSAGCCCSATAKFGEPGACCATKAAKSCCATKGTTADDRPRVVWVAGIFARGCKAEHGPTGLPAAEPAVPPLMTAAPVPLETVADAILPADARSTSLPAVPPDPPPRFPG